ncbi:MAG TPA: translational GTPase TypA, partial [Balneola sp.]|nr:translational GTPase TypA [Balneola sp.]
LAPLMDTIVEHVPAPAQPVDETFKMLVSSIDWNDYVGRIAVGRIEQGAVKLNQEIALVSGKGDQKMKGRATKLFSFNGLQREPIEEGFAGDIVALAGYDSVNI